MNLSLYGKFFGLVTGIGATIGSITYTTIKNSKENPRISFGEYNGLEDQISEFLNGSLQEGWRTPRQQSDWEELIQKSYKNIKIDVKDAKDFCKNLILQQKTENVVEYKELALQKCIIKNN